MAFIVNFENPAVKYQRQMDAMITQLTSPAVKYQRQMDAMITQLTSPAVKYQRQMDAMITQLTSPAVKYQRQMDAMITQLTSPAVKYQRQMDAMIAQLTSPAVKYQRQMDALLISNLNNVRTLDDQTLIKVAAEVNQKKPEQFAHFLDANFAPNDLENNKKSVRNVISPNVVAFSIRLLIGCLLVGIAADFDISDTIWSVLSGYILPSKSDLNKDKK
ncbi:hypothetical protein [Peribacillus frigoritolerans]|uniref:hypothetical protein n=1 Tax=Peribacillus frigoritolerans TaxID=450367 RepID=UPI0039A2DF6A